MSDIDPRKLYSFAEAAEMIPSQWGRHLSVTTLHRWRDAGIFKAVERIGPRGHKRFFIWGSELQKLIPVPPAEVDFRSPAQSRAKERALEKEARRLGYV